MIQLVCRHLRPKGMIAFAFAMVLLASCQRVGAQESPSPAVQQTPAATQSDGETVDKATAQTHPNNPELWNVDKMMEEAVLQISRRYNLNKAQEEYTRLLLVNRTRAFLDVYEKDVRELLRESIDLRLGLKPGTMDAYKRWAERAAPIYAAAQKAILDGNEEWGAILDATQKQVHDADLAAMRTSFAQVDRMIETWKSGGQPQVALASSEQNAPQQSGLQGGGKMQEGRVSEPHQPVVQQQVEDTWLAYVNRFIRTYKLDEKQAISARDKIYKDIRDQATQYREKRKNEFAALEAEALAIKPKLDRKEIDQRRRDLERPIGEMFVTLDQRLRALPDRKQLDSADPAEVRQLEEWYKLLAGQYGAAEKAAKPEAKTVKPSEAKPAEKGEEAPAAKSEGPKSAAPALPSQPGKPVGDEKKSDAAGSSQSKDSAPSSGE